jgi:protein-S-isoprenylcysteine O-methyltransferase Ste14
MRAAFGTLVFALTVPASVIMLVPWLMTSWKVQPPFLGWAGTRWIGAACLLAGLPIVAGAMVRFVREGRGTPAPIAPTQRLVVTGPYRYVRNPMYVGVVASILAQALIFGSLAVLAYAALLGVVFHAFVLCYEEPTLRRRYGAQYDAYTRGVHRWRPRLVPWSRQD